MLLADQRPASAVLHSVLAHAVRTFPDAMAEVELPAGAEAFRREYPECLPGFEAARAGSRRRTEIARAAVAELQRHLIWQGPEGMRPLGEALTLPAEPLSLDVHEFTGEPGWEPGLTYRGERWPGSRLPALADDLVSRGMATGDAGSGLTWVASECLEGGRLYLPRRKIAVLGAGAEMAPTRFWLEAGAEVLWLDVVPPPAAWRDVPGMAGRLHWPAAGVDLLARPQEVLATLMAFADGEPVDLGLFAYAPGQARELLLTGVMNEIVNALPRPLLRTVTLLVSPTTPTALTAEDQPAIEARRENRPG